MTCDAELTASGVARLRAPLSETRTAGHCPFLRATAQRLNGAQKQLSGACQHIERTVRERHLRSIPPIIVQLGPSKPLHESSASLLTSLPGTKSASGSPQSPRLTLHWGCVVGFRGGESGRSCRVPPPQNHMQRSNLPAGPRSTATANTRQMNKQHLL